MRVLKPSVSSAIAALVLCTGCGGSDSSRETLQATTEQAVPQISRQREAARPSNTRRLGARDLVAKLSTAGLETTDLGPAPMSVDHTSLFPEEPRSTLRLRVADGRGNSTPMTFIEFGSWKAAAKLDAKRINGFAVRNWFVLGTISNYFVDLVTEALSS